MRVTHECYGLSRSDSTIGRRGGTIHHVSAHYPASAYIFMLNFQQGVRMFMLHYKMLSKWSFSQTRSHICVHTGDGWTDLCLTCPSPFPPLSSSQRWIQTTSLQTSLEEAGCPLVGVAAGAIPFQQVDLGSSCFSFSTLSSLPPSLPPSISLVCAHHEPIRVLFIIIYAHWMWLTVTI